MDTPETPVSPAPPDEERSGEDTPDQVPPASTPEEAPASPGDEEAPGEETPPAMGGEDEEDEPGVGA